jgi:hypothetical protein
MYNPVSKDALTLPVRQNLLGFRGEPFGSQLPGPFNLTIGTGSHLPRLSETCVPDLLVPFTAFYYSIVFVFYCTIRRMSIGYGGIFADCASVSEINMVFQVEG